MYYEQIHELIRAAAAANSARIEDLINEHGISRSTYYRHLKDGTPWKLKDIEAVSEITGKPTADILEMLKK